MLSFPVAALILTAAWLLLVAVRFRTSRVVLIGGLVIIGLFVLAAVLRDETTLQELGLGVSRSFLRTFGFAAAWVLVMLAYSPLADRVASAWFKKPPTLGAFRALQESRAKLMAGIVIAWILGGFLEELALRGVVLRGIETLLAPHMAEFAAAAIGVVCAAAGAFVIHLYQGLRAAVIVTQLSVLFGVLFVISGYDLWTVMLCHGFYDTVAFIRFANKQSKYSDLTVNDTPD